MVGYQPARLDELCRALGARDLLVAGTAAAVAEALDRVRPAIAVVDGDDEIGPLIRRLADLGIPVIAVTGEPERAAQLLEAGAVDVAMRPITGAVLRARVAAQLDLRAATAELERSRRALSERDEELREIARALESETAARTLMEHRLRFVARHDPLTHCLNRTAFSSHLRQVVSASGSRRAASLIYLDLDRFRVINDAAGPVAGDQLIREVAELIKRTVGDSDVVGRVGANAFALLCFAEQRVVETLAETLAGGVRQVRVEWEDKVYKTTASIAVVHLGAEFSSASQVMTVADSTCLAAKQAGRSQIRVHRGVVGETVKILRAEMSWAARLRDSIDRGRFQLMRQAIVPLAARPGGARFEVLLRMLGENDELISASTFLPAAERYDVIREIDRWVIARVFEWLAGRDDVELCSINLSGQSANDPGFAELIEQALAAHPVDPQVVCFELTETAAVSNLEQVAALMARLRRRGVRFALDDFGSGFSSYAYLKSLPVDHVKIDGMFVKDILADSVDEAMVASANELAHLTGKATIAEFVESLEIAEKLTEIGVDYGQGYGLAVPVPLESS